MKELIYLDHAATTKLDERVFTAMQPYLTKEYGNPSSIYDLGAKSKAAIMDSREIIAKALGAKASEIYFTAGGSESDNWAIIGAVEANRGKGRHIITTKIEHHAILHTCAYLESHGVEVTYLDVNRFGRVDLEQLKSSIRDDTILISVMYANNEIGTIQPIREIGKIAGERGVLFHTDAVQAFSQIPINVEESRIDLLSISGHKLYGPKGVGVLYIRNGVKLPSLIHGGGQERGKRAGTENVPGIVGLAKATELAVGSMNASFKKKTELRDYLIARIIREVPDCVLNGDIQNRLPGNANFSFRFIEGESLVIMLDIEGICASSGSACSAGSANPSHVLMAIGQEEEFVNGSLRLSLGRENTKEEIDFAVEKIKLLVARLRERSPKYQRYLRQHVRLNGFR